MDPLTGVSVNPVEALVKVPQEVPGITTFLPACGASVLLMIGVPAAGVVVFNATVVVLAETAAEDTASLAVESEPRYTLPPVTLMDVKKENRKLVQC